MMGRQHMDWETHCRCNVCQIKLATFECMANSVGMLLCPKCGRRVKRNPTDRVSREKRDWFRY